MAYWGNSRIASRPAFGAVLRYGLAVVSVATALGATFVLRHYDLPPRFISHVTLIAIAITFWYAGTAPGLLAFLLSCLGLTLLDRSHLLLSGFPLESFLIFTAIFSLLVSWFSASRRRTQQLLSEAHNTLERRVSERTADLVRANDDLQNAEAELRRSEALAEQRLRLVVDTTPALINSCRPDGYLDYVNKGWLDYFGFSLETALDRADVMKMPMPSKTEISGSDWQPVIHPDDLPGFTEQWKSMLVSGKPGEREARARRFDGVYRWLLFRAVPLYDETGKLVKWYASAFDIEDRKRAEEALKRSESNLAEAQRLAHAGSWAWRVAGRRALHLSDEWYRIYGFDPQKAPPAWEERLERIHPEDRAKWQGAIDRAIDEKSDYEVEVRILLPDGTVKYIHTVGHPVLNASGDLIEFVGSATDVTERKQSEDALRRSESYLAEAQRLTHTASWAWRVAGRDFLHLSEEWYRIYAFDPQEGIPAWEEVLQRIHPGDQTKWRDSIDRAIGEKSDYEMQYRILLPSGSLKYIQTVGHPVLNASGDLVQFVGSATEVTERKQAEDALRRSESSLHEAQKLGQLGSWIWDRSSGTVFASPELLRIIGVNPEEKSRTRGMMIEVGDREAFGRHVHPGDRLGLDEIARKAVTEKKDWEFEYRIVLPNGSMRFVHTRGRPVFDDVGELVEYIGTMMDITERKQAEVALRRSEGYLAEAQRLTRTGSWAWNVATRQSVYWSQENYRLFGFDPEGGIPPDEAFYARIHPEDRDRVRRDVFLERPDEGSHFDVDFRIVFPEGAIKYVRSTGNPVRNPSGELIEYVGTSIDVTERKRVEEERERLLASERAAFTEAVAAQQRFRDLVNSVEGIVWEADVPSCQFLFISKQAERVLGYPVERWLSEPGFWQEHVHPEDREWAVQFCQNATAEKRDHEFEYRMIAADGSVVWLRDLITVVVEGDRVTRVRGVMVDLTNRKLAEDALRQAQADLAHVSRVTTMGELTVSLAHEVNQPIAAAVTNANTCLRWLASGTPNIEEARAAAMRIVKDGTRAGEIISRIRMLFTKGTAQHELIDVNEVIGEMIVLLRAETARHSISVRTELAADLPQVMGDRVQLQQVLMNLMINGVDAMQDADGTRELAIKSQRTENDEVTVSVIDTGVGLPTQQAEQIFNAFFTTKPNGTGMGLRISRSIIESHGGRLWADDNSPRGATFHFTLPTKAEPHE
jgi:PAS domain S-box-containing protein